MSLLAMLGASSNGIRTAVKTPKNFMAVHALGEPLLSSSILVRDSIGEFAFVLPRQSADFADHEAIRMSHVADEHRASAPEQIGCALVTVSDTRTTATDTGGQLLHDLIVQAGMLVRARTIIPDEPGLMRTLLEAYRDDPQIDAVLLTGGTGMSSRDQTFETVSALV